MTTIFIILVPVAVLLACIGWRLFRADAPNMRGPGDEQRARFYRALYRSR